MEYIIAALLVYGITNIIVRGSIFFTIKDKIEDLSIEHENNTIKYIFQKTHVLVNCMMCSGFWVGSFIGIFYGPFDSWNILFNGAYYSGICWIFQCVTQYLGQGEEPERSMDVHINNYMSSDEED